MLSIQRLFRSSFPGYLSILWACSFIFTSAILLANESKQLKALDGNKYWDNAPTFEVWNLVFSYLQDSSDSPRGQLSLHSKKLQQSFSPPLQRILVMSEGELFRLIATDHNGDELFATDFEAKSHLGEAPESKGPKQSLKLEQLELVTSIPKSVDNRLVVNARLYRLLPDGKNEFLFELPIVEKSGSSQDSIATSPSVGSLLKDSTVPYQIFLHSKQADSANAEISNAHPSLDVRAQTKDGDGFFDIVVTADDLTEANLIHFNRFVENLVQRLFSLQPFAAYQSGIRVHVLSNLTEDLGCRHSNPSVPRVVTCNSSKVYGFINSTGIPYEHGAVLVMYFSPQFGGAATNLGVCTTGTPETSLAGPANCLLHELSHSAFQLMDEYAYNDPGYPSEGPEYNEVRMNCYMGSRLPATEWMGLIADRDYTPDCRYAHNYYRSHSTSLMQSTTSLFYNWPSHEIVRMRLEEVIGVSDSDRDGPIVSWSSVNSTRELPQGELILHPWATDESGSVPWIRLLVNGQFIRSIYGSDQKLKISADELGGPNGSTIQFEAVDVFGNRTLSASTDVTFTSKKDRKGPKVQWISPGKKVELGSSTEIKVKVSDDSGVDVVYVKIKGELIHLLREGDFYKNNWTPKEMGSSALVLTTFDAKNNRTNTTLNVKVK